MVPWFLGGRILTKKLQGHIMTLKGEADRRFPPTILRSKRPLSVESQAVVSVLFFMRPTKGKAQAEAGNHQADYGDKFHQTHENALLSNHPRKGADSRRANRPSGLVCRREPPTVFGFTNSIVRQADKWVQLQFIHSGCCGFFNAALYRGMRARRG